MSRSASHQPPAAATLARQSSVNNGVLLRKCSCGNKSGSGEKCHACGEQEEESLHRKASAASPSHEAPSIVHDVLRDQGQPLDADTRADMEQRFGHDFAHVRVHTDGRAAESVRAVGALAYTVGQHVVFGANQLAPTTTAGRHLLAHELAHTVQQRATGERRQNRLVVRDHDSADERAADRAADIAVRGGPVTHAMPALATGHAMAGSAVQRKGGLLPPEKVHEIYVKWIGEYFKARGTNVMTDAMEKEIRERVKQQVGPGNFANYERWDKEEADKSYAEAEAKNKPKETKPFNPEADMVDEYAAMWKATKGLREEIVRTEYLAQKLNFGGGAKGAVARATAGGYTAMWGIGGRTLTSVSEHAPMMVLGTAGTVLGSETAEKFLVKQGQAVKQEGEEMGADARTAVRLVGGDLQAAYQATRPAYNKYQKAFSTFTDHSVQFNRDGQLDGINGYVARSKDIAGMKTAMKEMREAGNEFLMACAKMGIETDARALDKMGENIIKGLEGTLETAVTGVLPELAPGLGEIRSALKGTKGMGAKQVEKEAADAVAQLAKGADDVPLKSGAKPPAAKPPAAKPPAAKPPAGKPDAAAAADDAVLAKEPGKGGHDIEVTKNGVEICSPQPCPVLEVEYAKELKKAPELGPELREINQLRKVDPKKAAEKAAALQGKLEGIRTKAAAGKGAPKAGDMDAPAAGDKGPDAGKGREAKSRKELKEEQAAATATAKEQASQKIQDKEELLDQIFKENKELSQRGKTPLSDSARKELDLEKAANAREANKVIDDLEQLRKQKEALEITPLGKARAYSHSGSADRTVRSRAKNLDELSGKPIKEASVDHVVPIDEIVLMDGWTKLGIDEQRAILSRADNLRLMEKAINSSKGARRWVNWPAGRRHYPQKYQEMVELEGTLRESIRKEIEALAAMRHK